jgi:hypothetical protein
MSEVGSDLLRVASFALVARGYEQLGNRLLSTRMELLEGAANAQDDFAEDEAWGITAN